MGKNIVDFCEDPLALNLKLWPKQAEILEELWEGNYQEIVLALGRRSGKTLLSAVIAIYAAVVKAPQYKAFLRPGEPFYIVTIANTESQSKIALGMITGLMKESPILKNLIVKETADELWLSNGARFRALPASSRGARGLACPVLIFDEIGHSLSTDGNAGGKAVYESLSPSIAQFGSAGRIILLSSPWIDSGIFYDLFLAAQSGDFPNMVCFQLPSWEVNPTLDKQWLDAQRARAPITFDREFGASFGSAINQFLDSELIDEAINPGRAELPPNPKYRGRYFLSLDPAKGGQGRDSYVACLSHFSEKQKFVVDLWHEFSPTYAGNKKKEVDIRIVENFIIDTHQKYGCKKIVLDQHNSVGTIQRLQQHVAGSRASNRTIIDPYGRAPGKVNRGFPISELTWTAPRKCEAYSKMLELFNSGNIELYPCPTAIKQLKNLRRLFKSNGDWTVAGSSGGGNIGGSAVDDYCAALAGAILIAQQENSSKRMFEKLIGQ